MGRVSFRAYFAGTFKIALKMYVPHEFAGLLLRIR